MSGQIAPDDLDKLSEGSYDVSEGEELDPKSQLLLPNKSRTRNFTVAPQGESGSFTPLSGRHQTIKLHQSQRLISDTEFELNPQEPKKKEVQKNYLRDIKVKMELTKCEMCNIVLYNQIEPMALTLILSIALTQPQVETFVYAVFLIFLRVPLIGAATKNKVICKLVTMYMLFAFSIGILTFKIWAYEEAKKADITQFNKKWENPAMFGIFKDEAARTFLVSTCLIIMNMFTIIFLQKSQYPQAKDRQNILAILPYQNEIKIAHPKLGLKWQFQFAQTQIAFITSATVIASLSGLISLFLGLIIIYLQIMGLQMSRRLRVCISRFIQVMCVISIMLKFVSSFIDDLYFFKQDDQSNVDDLAASPYQIYMNFAYYILTAYVLCQCSVYVFYQNLHEQYKEKLDNKKDQKKIEKLIEQPSLRKQGLIEERELNKQEMLGINLQTLWKMSHMPFVLWGCRILCFTWAYMFYDWQSLVPLFWVLHSLIHRSTVNFRKWTTYLYIPLIQAQIIFYYVINYWLITNWIFDSLFDPISSDEYYQIYNYGFYYMTIPPLEYWFMLLTIIFLSMFVVMQRRTEKRIESGDLLSPQDLAYSMRSNNSLLWQFFYIFVVYCDFPFFFTLSLCALYKLDVFNVILFMLYIGYTLCSDFFRRNGFIFLIYGSTVIVSQYIYSLLLTKSKADDWAIILGIDSTISQDPLPLIFRLTPSTVQWMLVVLCFVIDNRSKFLGRNQKQIDEEVSKYKANIFVKCPKIYKYFVYFEILLHRILALICFATYISLLLQIERTFLNLVSLLITFTVMCVYLSRGLHALLKIWKVLMLWQAFVLLSLVWFQFIVQSPVKNLDQIKELYKAFSPYQRAIFYWVGYRPFTDNMIAFTPYVLMYSFALFFQPVWKEMLVVQTTPLQIWKDESDDQHELYQKLLKDDTVVHRSSSFQDNLLNMDESSQNEQLDSLQDQNSLDPIKKDTTRFNHIRAAQKLKEILAIREKEKRAFIIRNYYLMKYKVSWLVWKMKLFWSAFNHISHYFHLVFATLILWIGLYYQIGLIWFSFLLLFSLQSQRSYHAHKKFMLKEQKSFQPSIPQESPEDDIIELDAEPQQEVNVEEVDKFTTQEKKNNQNRQVVYLTDEEAITQFGNFWDKVSVTTLVGRETFWTLKFSMLIFLVCAIYLSTYLDASWTDDITKRSVFPIQNEALREKYMFIAFWVGFYRPQRLDAFDDGLPYDFWPIYMLFGVLVLERLCQWWLHDRYGLTEELIEQYKQITEIYEHTVKHINNETIARKQTQMKKQEENKSVESFKTDSDWDDPQENQRNNTPKSIRTPLSISGQGPQSPGKSFVLLDVDQNQETLNKDAEINFDNYFKQRRDEADLKDNNQQMIEDRKQLVETLKPYLIISEKIQLNRSIKIFLEQLVTLLIWTSLIYKQSLFSYFMFFILFMHSWSAKKTTFPLERLRLLVNVVLVLEYGLAVSNLSSYNTPTPFPAQLYIGVQPQTNQTIDYGVYPNIQNHYFGIPWFFELSREYNQTVHYGEQPQIIVYNVEFFQVNITPRRLNGMWIDFFVIVYIVIYLNTCNCWLLYQQVEVVKSEKTKANLQAFQEINKQLTMMDLTIEECLLEIKTQIPSLNAYKYLRIAYYVNYDVVLISFLMLVCVMNRTLLTVGYLIFTSCLIYTAFGYFASRETRDKRRNVLAKYFIPYVLFDICLQLIYQLPLIALEDDSKAWIKAFGFVHVWQSNPATLWFGEDVNVEQNLDSALVLLLLKGIIYFLVMLQIKILYSDKFNNNCDELMKKQLLDNHLIWKGLSFRHANFKNKKVVKAAKDLDYLHRMLKRVKKLIKLGQKLYQLDGSKDQEKQKGTLKKSKTVNLAKIPEQDEENDDEFNLPIRAGINGSDIDADSIGPHLRDQFYEEVAEDFKARMKKLGSSERFYIYIRRHFVEDILFHKSRLHLEQIVKNLQAGRTFNKTGLENGLMLESKLFWLKTKRKEYQIKIDEKEVSEETLFQLDELERETRLEASLDQFTKKKLKEYRSGKTLLKNYISALVKIILSHMNGLCYFAMMICCMSNGGVLYLVYPILIFTYALVIERDPTPGFWRFIIMYTLGVIWLQFLVQLELWDLIASNQSKSLYYWTQRINLGLTYLETYDFNSYMQNYWPLISVLILCLVNLQLKHLYGSFDHRPYEHEPFEDGLRRFTLNIVKDDEEQFKKVVQKFQQEDIVNLGKKDYEQFLHKRKAVSEYNLTLEKSKQNQLILKNDVEEQLKQNTGPQSVDVMVVCGRKEHKIRITERMTYRIHRCQRWFIMNEFMSELFPQIKQEKPGHDFYIYQLIISFILCIYIILFYGLFTGSTENASLEQQYASNQFSGFMVLLLFLMIFFMVMDRIIYTTYNSEELKDIVSRLDQNAQSSQKISSAVSQSTTSNLRKTNTQSLPSIVPLQEEEMLPEDDDFTPNTKEQMSAYALALQPQRRKQNFALAFRYYWFLFLIGFIHWILFFRIPRFSKYCTPGYNHLYPYQCNQFSKNPWLITFYVLFCIYFWLLALQIKYGQPELRRGSFFNKRFDTISKAIYEVWLALPFLFELRSIIDWTFTYTSLSVYQWLKCAQVQSDMYIAKCYNRAYMAHKLGEPQSAVSKCLNGFTLMIVCLGLLAFPWLLFSTFDPAAVTNPVESGKLEFYISVDDQAKHVKYNITLFETNQLTVTPITQSQYDALGFGNSSYKLETGAYSPDQVQVLSFEPFATDSWIISQPQRQNLYEYLYYEKLGWSNRTNITAHLDMQFTRSVDTTPTTYNRTSYQLSNETEQQLEWVDELLTQLWCKGENTNDTTYFGVENTLMLQLDATDSITPFQNMGFLNSTFNLGYVCESRTASNNYWSVYQILTETNNPSLEEAIDDLCSSNNGMCIIAFSKKVEAGFLSALGGSIIVFYTTVVLIASSSFRSALVPTSNDIFIVNAPFTEDILMICTAIFIYRVQKKLELEEELYFILIDIMRSPEMIKTITGSSLKKKLD